MQPIQPSDLFVTVAQMRDGIETLIQRGKPATATELQQLLGQVQAQGEQLLSQARQGYHITLNGEAAAKLIVPYMPTNSETARIMAEATATMQQTLAQGQQQTAAQLKQLQAIQTSFPRQVSIEGEVVGFTNWKAAALVALVPLVLVLLMLWFTGMFSRVPKADWEAAVQANKNLSRQGVFYRDQVEAYRKNHPKSAADFPPYVAPTTPAPAAE